jgi:Icc-related predicted phosphoesterase
MTIKNKIYMFWKQRKREKEKKYIKIFFATDIHGSELTFRKFLRVPEFYGADVLILGGDLTGKALVPILKLDDDTYHSNFLGQKYVLKTEVEVLNFEERVNTMGYYPCRMDRIAFEKFDKEQADKLFMKLMEERLKRWVKMAEERLGRSGVECYITGGNDDPFKVEEILRSSSYIKDPENEVVSVKGYEMISLGFSNPTPWKTPREISEEELARRIDALVSRLEKPEESIFNIHVPPIDSGLDTCPKLDGSVYPPKPIFVGPHPVYYGAGSKAVRDAIERHCPLLGLHGHIHESRGVMRVGKTLCVNAGSEYGEGILDGALIILSTRKKAVLNYQLVSG